MEDDEMIPENTPELLAMDPPPRSCPSRQGLQEGHQGPETECARSIFPGEIRTDEDYMARYDIERWLETGTTTHFVVPAIYKLQS